MQMRIRCDCGDEIVSDDSEELIALARRHAAEAHQMEIPAERILALAEPAPQVVEPGRGDAATDTKGGLR